MIFVHNLKKCKWSTPKPSIILEEKTGCAQVAPKIPKRAFFAPNPDFDPQRHKMCSTCTLFSTGRFWAKWLPTWLQVCREFRHGRKCSNSILVCKVIKMIPDGIRNSQNGVVAKNKLTKCHDFAFARESLFYQCYLNGFYPFCAQMFFLSDFPFLSPKVQKGIFCTFWPPGHQFRKILSFWQKVPFRECTNSHTPSTISSLEPTGPQKCNFPPKSA